MRKKYALIAILAGVPLGLIAFAAITDEDGVAAGTATGIGTALLTGGIAAGYVAWRDHVWATWVKALCAKYENEGVVHHGQARLGHSIGVDLAFVLLRAGFLADGIDGWLVLTNRRLVFHPRERGHPPAELAVSDIAEVRRGSSTIPNTIEIRMRNQQSIVVRVQKRDEWLGAFANFEGITLLR